MAGTGQGAGTAGGLERSAGYFYTMCQTPVKRKDPCQSPLCVTTTWPDPPGIITAQVALGQQVQEPAQWCHTAWDTILHGAHVYLPFHFLPSQGEKAQQAPGELQDAPAVFGCSLAMAPVAQGWGTACLLLPRCSRNWDRSTSSGCKTAKKYFRLCFPAFLHLQLRVGNLPTPPRHKAPSCQCRTGNTSPVQSQVADTENVLKHPLLLPKTFKLFRALGPTPSKNTNKHSMKSEPHSPCLLIPRCPHRRHWRRTKAH